MRHCYLLSRILVIAEGTASPLWFSLFAEEGPEASDRPFAPPCSPALSSTSMSSSRSEEMSMANTAAAAASSSMAAEQLAAAL